MSAGLTTAAPRAGTSARGFAAFVDANARLMRDYVDWRLRSQTGNDIDREAVLQDALMRVWGQWDAWPTDPNQAQRYLRNALKLAALDALRARFGRDGERPREQPVDFSLIGAAGETDITVDVAELSDVLARAAADETADAVLARSVVLAGLAALTPTEQRALALVHQGYDDKEIARELGVTHQKARTLVMDARAVARQLIEHADGRALSTEEADNLFALLEGRIANKRHRRLAQRHLDACSACQRVAALHRDTHASAARMYLPLPAVAAAALQIAAGAGAGATAIGTAGAGTATATSGVGAVSMSGGSATVSTGLSLAAKPVLAKLAVAAVLAGGGTGAYQAMPSAAPARPAMPTTASAALAGHPDAAEPGVLRTASEQLAIDRRERRARNRRLARERAARARARERAREANSQGAANEPTVPPTAAETPAVANSTPPIGASPAPDAASSPTTGAPRSSPQAPSSADGGQFDLGGTE